MWNAVSKIETAITIGGIKLTILNEPDDPMVWISLAESDVPEGTEAFCFAGGDTLDDAVGKAIELFTVCADQLAAFRTLERATARNAQAGAVEPPESVGAHPSSSPSSVGASDGREEP